MIQRARLGAVRAGIDDECDRGQQPGFVAFEVGSNETDPNSTISATYWRDKNDAENAYAAPAYTAILNKIRTLVAADFRPVFYNVELSTMHQISLVKAA